VQERINFVVGVRKGLRELDEGKGIPHDRVREEFAQWGEQGQVAISEI
jgi:predicted transcriptional regulator